VRPDFRQAAAAIIGVTGLGWIVTVAIDALPLFDQLNFRDRMKGADQQESTSAAANAETPIPKSSVAGNSPKSCATRRERTAAS
jgi:hypothetical protein